MRIAASVWLISSVFIVNLPSLPSTVIILVFLAATLLLALIVPRSRAAVCGFLLAVIMLGVSFLQLAYHQLTPDQISTDHVITVRVTGVPDQRKGRLAFVAKVLSCESCETAMRARKAQLSWYGSYPQVRAGDVWQFTLRLKPPASLRNAGGLDGVAWALVKGLHAKGYVREAHTARRLASAQYFSLSSVRQAAADRLGTLVSDSDQLGLLQALTVGVKTQVTQTQWKLLRSTGTAHLLAISGLHVGLVAAWALVFGRRLSELFGQFVLLLSAGHRRVDFRVWVLCGSLGAAVVYAALAGFELPTQRAVLMLSVWVLAALRFRFLPPLAALCMALGSVLFFNPLSVLSAGFWLSFGTVAALFFLHGGHLVKRTKPHESNWQAIRRKVQTLGRTHVSLGIMLIPVGAWFFQKSSLIGPIANLVAVPWVALISVPLSLLGLVCTSFSDVTALFFLHLADHSLAVLFSFLRLLDSSPMSSIVLTLPGGLAFVFVLLGLLVLFAPRGLRLRWLALPLFIPAVVHNQPPSVSDGFEVHVLDVGQGLAALVFAGEQTLLFDTGGKVSPELSMFEAVIVPFLHASGRRKIDTLVVSHGDEDHAFGVADVVRRYPDVRLLTSRQTNQESVHPESQCHAGVHWEIGEVKFAFVNPSRFDRGSDNDRSCVLLVFMGKSSVLLTGDIEADAEQRLVSRLENSAVLPLTLITAPHHGSRTSSSASFVDKIRPEYVVFPAGRRNRYGFPHGDVQLRYNLVGSTTFTTGDKGALSFVFGPEGLSVPPASWWDSRRRFWHGIVNPDCWQRFAGQSLALRLLELSQKGQMLCGK